MNYNLTSLIENFENFEPDTERKFELEKFSDYLFRKLKSNDSIKVIFICTHNSRRSHLGQVWAYAMSRYFKFENFEVYSGGTEATAVYHKVIKTLLEQGFAIDEFDKGDNPKYRLKTSENENGIVLFSKAYFDEFNPQKDFAAVMTCGDADEACPVVLGAEERFAIKYTDPKAFDNTPEVDEKYLEKSIEIAEEMYWVFSRVKEGLGR